MQQGRVFKLGVCFYSVSDLGSSSYLGDVWFGTKRAAHRLQDSSNARCWNIRMDFAAERILLHGGLAESLRRFRIFAKWCCTMTAPNDKVTDVPLLLHDSRDSFYSSVICLTSR